MSPTEYDVMEECLICGQVRSADHMISWRRGWVCEPPPDLSWADGKDYTPAWDEYHRTHDLRRPAKRAVEPGLDIERLAQALWDTVGSTTASQASSSWEATVEKAQHVAAAYARLAIPERQP